MKNYNNLYKQNKNIWGKKPNELLDRTWKEVQPGSYFLDLGCGQGRDSLFMAQQGFKVTTVDESIEGIKTLQKLAEEKNLENIQTICSKLEEYNIEKDKYSIINIINIFQYLKKEMTLRIINEVKENLKESGYIIIKGFTIHDPSYKKKNRKENCYFKDNELADLFSDFKIIFYKEDIIDDKGHPGYEKFHQHGVVQLIARKDN